MITSDIAGHMVADALNAGLPAIRQRAQFLFLRDDSVDAVLLAYGTHHIPREDRQLACREGARVLRPGGRLVLHDFEEGSPTAIWFSEVVDRYSNAGHAYDHFSQAEFYRCCVQGGLHSVSVQQIYDPLITTGDSPDEARSRLAGYLLSMYGLDRLGEPWMSQADLHDEIWRLAHDCFVYDEGDLGGRTGLEVRPAVYRAPAGHRPAWVAEVPRVALVAVGRKLGTGGGPVRPRVVVLSQPHRCRSAGPS